MVMSGAGPNPKLSPPPTKIGQCLLGLQDNFKEMWSEMVHLDYFKADSVDRCDVGIKQEW